MQNQIQELLYKEVSRREFLNALGIGVASLMGLSTLLKLAGYKSHSHLSQTSTYGSSPYGR